MHLLTRLRRLQRVAGGAACDPPDHTATAVSSWDTSGLALPVLQPHIGGRVAFLIGPRRMAAGDHERASIWSRIGSLEDPE